MKVLAYTLMTCGGLVLLSAILFLAVPKPVTTVAETDTATLVVLFAVFMIPVSLLSLFVGSLLGLRLYLRRRFHK